MKFANPKLVRKWDRAVRALNPAEDIRLKAATKKAIQGDGTINPLAMNLTGGFLIIPLFRDANVNNASNSVWVEHLSQTIDLGGGIWNIVLLTFTRCGNSSTDNVNLKQQLNGVDGDEILTRIGLATGDSAYFLPNTFLGVSGDEPIEIKTLFKPNSTGTSNIRDDMTVVIATRQ